MQKRDIQPGRAYGDGKKGKRLVLWVTEDMVRYRLIAATRTRDEDRIGGEFQVKRSNFASWAVDTVYDPPYLHDDDVQRSLDDDARRKAGRRKPWPPLLCTRCGLSKPVEAYRLEQRETKTHLCAPCEEAQWDEVYERAQAEMMAKAAQTKASVSAKTQSDHQSRYANVGLSRSRAKVAASRENGRKGGRPPKWSPEAREAAARLLRTAARSKDTDKQLRDELARMAQALEDGALR